MIGTAPKCIEALNDVELAMLSKGRCEKHIFSYSAGAHSQIRGFHTIYQNDVEHSNAVLNYMEQRSANNITENSDGEDNEGDNDYQSLQTIVEDASLLEENDQDFNHDNSNNKTTPICVILAGAFTSTQVALTKKRTEINRLAMRKAMKWLSKNNLRTQRV